MTPLESIQFKHLVERVLHAPGNRMNGVPEIAFVFHTEMPAEKAQALAKEWILTLKKQNELFRNVRLNIVLWDGDDNIRHIVTSSAAVQTGAFFAEFYVQTPGKRRLELLMESLKLFQARAKLILLCSDGEYNIEDEERLKAALKPFLNRKLIKLEQGQMQLGVMDRMSLL